MQIIASEPLMPYYETYLKVSRLLSEQYLKSSPSVDDNPHYFTER